MSARFLSETAVPTVVQILGFDAPSRPTADHVQQLNQALEKVYGYPTDRIALFDRHNMAGTDALRLATEISRDIIASCSGELSDPVIVVHLPQALGAEHFGKVPEHTKYAAVLGTLLQDFPSILRVHEFSREGEDEKAIIADLARCAGAIVVSTGVDRQQLSETMGKGGNILIAPAGSNIPVKPGVITNTVDHPTYFGLLASNRGLEEIIDFAVHLKSVQKIVEDGLKGNGSPQDIVSSGLTLSDEESASLTVISSADEYRQFLQPFKPVLSLKARLVGRIRDETYFRDNVLRRVAQHIPAFTDTVIAATDRAGIEAGAQALSKIGLPLETHLNVDEDTVSRLLGETRLFLNFRTRGATQHSGGIAAALTHGCVPVMRIGDETPPELATAVAPMTSPKTAVDQIAYLLRHGHTLEGQSFEAIQQAGQEIAACFSQDAAAGCYDEIIQSFAKGTGQHL